MKVVSALRLCALALVVHAKEPTTLKLTQTIPLPGVNGRFDHIAVDVKGRRLFVAALGNNTLEVLDLAAGKGVKSITGLHKPTGVLFLAEANQIGVASGDDGSFKRFDAASYALLNNLRTLDDADNVRLDPAAKLIYVGYGDGALGITDPTAAKLIAGIKLPAHPESFQLERQGKRIFVNLPDAKQVAVVDRDERNIVARWGMEKFQANFPMALDESSHRLFVGCRKPPRFVVFNTETGAPVADLEISGDTDDLFFDPKRNRLYLSCGEGFLDVIQRNDGDRYQRLTRSPTRAGARTCFFSPELDRLYLAVPQRGGHEAEIRIYQPQ
ncbi:MAG: hypothetical protein HY300_13065 [Verrucomicrobia bacterium]|nr:hypothetical protein [Verrucomicrobiota bacterium]